MDFDTPTCFREAAPALLETPRDAGRLKGERTMDDSLVIAGRSFRSRLLMGTGKFSSPEAMKRAIEASQLDFPVEVGFWEPFTRDQSREIAGALASLGYRFDGLGGFSDERLPSQRDLSLAVGFAGLDPMRIRRWPNEAEMADLFRDVTVAADEYVAATAPGLTLGEMVAMLGRRADALAELWNEWGRIRPLLIAPV